MSEQIGSADWGVALLFSVQPTDRALVGWGYPTMPAALTAMARYGVDDLDYVPGVQA